VAAAHALADYIKKPTKNRILPSILDRKVTMAVAKGVKEAAIAGGCARRV